jgi:hypothetical protein
MALTYNQVEQAKNQARQLGDSTMLDRLFDRYGRDEVIRVFKEGPPAPSASRPALPQTP